MAKVSTKKEVKKDVKSNETKSKKTLGDKLLKKLGLKKERRGRPKKRKGFTLIELLAVIVILGLLMAIAIPSVTRYITQSRKKTLITTMGNYTGALVNEVNSLEYSLTASNTVYAIPIECIAVERGGNSPFGEWYQANDSYFAYVLVQYDEDSSSYRYAFTFKDSAGYGMYPTAQSSLSGNDKNIKTGLSLTRPKNGKVTTITDINNWGESGFAVTTDTNLVVLVSESEGKVGNGITTCTLQQKGSNYAQVEEEKKQNSTESEELKGDAYALVLDNSANPNDKLPMIFVRSETPIKAGDTYNSDRYGNILVKDAYTGFETEVYTGYLFDIKYGHNASVLDTPWAEHSFYITSVIAEDKVRFASMKSLFTGFGLLSYADIGNLDISNVTSLSDLFYEANRGIVFGLGGGSMSPSGGLVIVGLDKWDTSHIIDMSGMFDGLLGEYGQINIGDISGWDTSNVTKMAFMFNYANVNSLDLSNWNVDKVTEWTDFNLGSNVIAPSKFQ